MQETGPHWFEAGLRRELLLAEVPFGVRREAARVLLELVGVYPSGSAHLSGRRSDRPGCLSFVDPPAVAYGVVGRSAAPVGPPLLQQHVQVGDGQADFLGDFRAGGLLGAAVLVDVTGGRGYSGRGRRAPEDEQPGRSDPRAGIASAVACAGLTSSDSYSGASERLSESMRVTKTSPLMSARSSSSVW